MISLKRAAVCAALVLAATSLSATEPSGVGAVDLAWKKAIIANDLEAILACYAPDAVAWLPDTPEAKGSAALRATYSAFLSANTIRDFTVSDTRYETKGERSVGWGHFVLTLVPKSGDGKPLALRGRFSEVAEKRDGRWVYVLDHASAEPPPASGAPK